jgi:sugar-phosphatase
VTSGGRELARKRLLHVSLPVPAILVAAEDVSEGKPSAEGFLAAASQLGVNPSRCIVIEDTPAGIQGALRAGCRVIALTTTFPKSSLHEADVVVESLADLQIFRARDRIEVIAPSNTERLS